MSSDNSSHETMEKHELPDGFDNTDNTDLSPEHRQYLLKRHGRLDLDPLPALDDGDPYNWPAWKKIMNLLLVSFHASMGTFIASAIIPAYLTISKDLNITLQQTSYLTAIQIAVYGIAPLFWKPLSDRYGRRSIFLISLVGSLVCNIGCAKSPTYAAMMVCRMLVAWFIAPPTALGSAVVAESFFRHERARYMGVWTVMITLGVAGSPFIFGFVMIALDYRWIYYIIAIINAVQLILYLFLGPETRYIGPNSSSKSNFYREYIHFGRIDPSPMTAYEFIEPFVMGGRASVVIPAVAYSMCFGFGAILVSVEIPQLLQLKFDLNSQQLGLQFLGLIVGLILGEQMGGSLSDYWMSFRARRVGKMPPPEYRLWLSYLGYFLTIIGVIVFLVQTQHAIPLHWNITPLVGVAIASFGNQVVTTVLITYSVDCNREDAASVGVFITFIRQMWGFVGPFWFPNMFESVGIAVSSVIPTVLILCISVCPTAVLHLRGQGWRADRTGGTV